MRAFFIINFSKIIIFMILKIFLIFGQILYTNITTVATISPTHPCENSCAAFSERPNDVRSNGKHQSHNQFALGLKYEVSTTQVQQVKYTKSYRIYLDYVLLNLNS